MAKKILARLTAIVFAAWAVISVLVAIALVAVLWIAILPFALVAWVFEEGKNNEYS